MAERFVDVQHSHSETSKATIKQYKSGLDRRLKELQTEFASVVSGFVVLTDHLKELLARLEEGANSGGQVETGPTDEAEMKSAEVDDQLFLW